MELFSPKGPSLLVHRGVPTRLADALSYIIFACLVSYLMIVLHGLWQCCSVHVPEVLLQERYLYLNFRCRPSPIRKSLPTL